MLRMLTKYKIVYGGKRNKRCKLQYYFHIDAFPKTD